MLVSWQFVSLAVLLGIGAVYALYFDLQARRAGEALSPAERTQFDTQFSSQSDRANMPRKFERFATATDRARGGKAGVALIAVVALIFYFL